MQNTAIQLISSFVTRPMLAALFNTTLQRTATHCNTPQHTKTQLISSSVTRPELVALFNTIFKFSSAIRSVPRLTEQVFETYHTCLWVMSPHTCMRRATYMYEYVTHVYQSFTHSQAPIARCPSRWNRCVSHVTHVYGPCQQIHAWGMPLIHVWYVTHMYESSTHSQAPIARCPSRWNRCVGHITHVYESCHHIHVWGMSHVHVWGMSHICTSHLQSLELHSLGALLHGTGVWVVSHMWMCTSHVTHVCMRPVTHEYEVCYTHMYESCHIYMRVVAHICMNRIIHMYEFRHTYEWIMSQIFMSHP